MEEIGVRGTGGTQWKNRIRWLPQTKGTGLISRPPERSIRQARTAGKGVRSDTPVAGGLGWCLSLTWPCSSCWPARLGRPQSEASHPPKA